MFITTEIISLEKMLSPRPEAVCGAMASFFGIVRNDQHGRKVSRLFYDCYSSMADKQIGRIVDEVKRKFGVEDVRVLHRMGWLEIGEIAVGIVVCARHREEAFGACRHMIEEIKKRAPIWKKEIYADGTSEWVTIGCESCGMSHE